MFSVLSDTGGVGHGIASRQNPTVDRHHLCRIPCELLRLWSRMAQSLRFPVYVAALRAALSGGPSAEEIAESIPGQAELLCVRLPMHAEDSPLSQQSPRAVGFSPTAIAGYNP